MNEPLPDEAARERLLRETAEPLARWTKARRAELDRAVRDTVERDRAQAVATFERLSGTVQARGPRRLALLLAAAAALILGVALGFLLRDRAATRAPSVWLGEQGEGALAPEGDVDAYDAFTWPAIDTVPARYRLTVWNAGETEPALRISDLVQPRYEPTPAELERLGPRIVWEIWSVDEDGAAIARLGGSSASRSRSR